MMSARALLLALALGLDGVETTVPPPLVPAEPPAARPMVFSLDGGERLVVPLPPELRDAGTSVPDAGRPTPRLPPWKYPFTFSVDEAKPHSRREVAAETRVVLDGLQVGADKASMMLITSTGVVDIWPHRHTSAELVYVLEGKVRVRGLSKVWTDVEAGDAVYLPPGTPHGWMYTGTTEAPSKLLVLYAPAGPERSFRDKGANSSTTAVQADEMKRPPLNIPAPIVMRKAKTQDFIIAGGKATVKLYFDKPSTKHSGAYLGFLRGAPGLAIPEHVHENEAELLFILGGQGEMVIDGKRVPVRPGLVVHVPPGRRHSFTLTSSEPLEALQFYSPSGPEQRFKQAAPPPASGLRSIGATPE
jgi:mannose-6-phosphate isomerase-like protein (cupin superfamily)